jgi:hypothetical protein
MPLTVCASKYVRALHISGAGRSVGRKRNLCKLWTVVALFWRHQYHASFELFPEELLEQRDLQTVLRTIVRALYVDAGAAGAVSWRLLAYLTLALILRVLDTCTIDVYYNLLYM